MFTIRNENLFSANEGQRRSIIYFLWFFSLHHNVIVVKTKTIRVANVMVLSCSNRGRRTDYL